MIRFDTKKDLEYYDNLHEKIHNKDKEIERLKQNIDTITKEEILDIIENYTGFFGIKVGGNKE